ncbi:MAG: gluconokinase [bacterium]
MARGWYLGIDLGTGSCKSLVVSEEFELLGFALSEYPALDVGRRWQEQDPDSLLQAAIDSAKSALEKSSQSPGDCRAISLGGALHSLVALDKRGKPLTGLLTWADGRASHQAARIKNSSLAIQLYQETGCPVHPMYPLYKIMWLREERPETFSRTRRLISAKEYVLWKLTGEFRVDYSVASGSGLMGVRSLIWSPVCLELSGIREEMLSEPASPRSVLGGLHGEAGGELGLPREVPVILGSSDAVNSSLGAGATRPSQATCMVGTSGALRIISAVPILDAKARTWCYAIDQGHWLVGGAINNGGVALSWLRDCLNEVLMLRREKDLLGFDEILEMAQKAEPGAGGVLCLPFFAGERSPYFNPNARAVFLGLTLEHGLSQLSRALIEGIGYRFRSIKQVLSELGIGVEEAMASGGFTKSRFWLQVMADILGIPLRVPRWGETSVLGAALWAIRSMSAEMELEKMGDLVSQAEEVYPNAVNRALYDRLFSMYEKAYECLCPVLEEMAR